MCLVVGFTRIKGEKAKYQLEEKNKVREEKEKRRVENGWRRPFNGYTFSSVAIPVSNYHKKISSTIRMTGMIN
jgi:hypothetical protein